MTVVRCRTFLLGRPFVIFSDHKGLQFPLKTKRLHPRSYDGDLIQRNIIVVHYYRGSENLAADRLSRICALPKHWETIALGEGEVVNGQEFCSETRAFVRAIERNYLKRPKAVSTALWSCRKDASLDGKLLKLNQNVVVPHALKRKCLILTYGCHAGQDATYNRLKENFFRSIMKITLVDFIQTCHTCSLTRPSFYDPPMAPVLTHAPMQCLAADYIGPLSTSNGHKYCLAVIDIYSRFPFVFPVKSLHANELCLMFKKVFSLCGYPDSILTDRGSKFESTKFFRFC